MYVKSSPPQQDAIAEAFSVHGQKLYHWAIVYGIFKYSYALRHGKSFAVICSCGEFHVALVLCRSWVFFIWEGGDLFKVWFRHFGIVLSLSKISPFLRIPRSVHCWLCVHFEGFKGIERVSELFIQPAAVAHSPWLFVILLTTILSVSSRPFLT